MKSRQWFSILGAMVIGLLCVVALINSLAAAQAPVPSTSGPVVSNPSGGVTTSPPANPSAVLYDQYDNPSALASVSQNFEAAYDPYDNSLADDFMVPANIEWNMNLVEVQGQYFNGPGPADSFNVFIYTEAITTPGTLVASRTGVTYTETTGNFAIPLDPPVVLPPGKYWVSVQANQNFTTAGEWGWTDRTITNTIPAAWQNPGNGFGTGCITWNTRRICIGDPSAADQVFRLSGSSNPYFPPLTCGLGAPGPWLYHNILPVPVYGSNVANDGTYIYAIGGYSFQTGSDVTQTVRYDPIANTWMGLAPVPQQVSMASAVYAPINHKLYVFGGEIIGTSHIYSSTLIYDISNNSWTTGAPMPDVRAFMSSGYYNGKIYLVGGYSTGSVSPAYAQTWEYDVVANTWLTKTSMPEPLGGAASAVVNGHLYVIGGRDGATSARNQTYDYDIALDSWSTQAVASYGVNVAGAAVLQNKIWVVGGGNPFLGVEGSSSLANTNAPEAMNTTMIYDPVANSWTSGPNLNIPRSFLGVTGFGNMAFAIGGYDGSSTTGATEITLNCPAVHFSAPAYNVNENAGSAAIQVTLNAVSPLTATVKYDTFNGTAIAGSDYITSSGTLTFTPGVISQMFPVGIIDDALFEENETIYLGLSGAANAAITVPNPAVLTIVDNDPPPPLACGNGSPGPWVLRSFLPVPVYGSNVANDGTYAYAIGGYSFQTGGDITQTVRYDPIANTWTGLAPVPKKVSMASAVYAPINHKLYVFGGEVAGTGAVYSSTLIYDIANNSWTTGAPMPDVRAFMSSGYYNGKIYLVGGYSTGSVSPAYAQTWEYDVVANTWLTKTSMTEPLGGAASAVVNGHLYVIGGRDVVTSARNQTYDYDIALDSWSTKAVIPYGVNVAGAAVLQNKIWVIGGGNPFLGAAGASSLANTNAPEAMNTTMVYDPVADSWTAGPNLNIQRSFVGATGFGSFAVAIGGYNGSTTTGATEVTALCSSDLSVAMTDAPDPVFVGQNLVYSIHVVNHGPFSATGVTLVDTLPPGVTFISASAGCAEASGVVTCSLPNLTNGGDAMVTITVSPTAAGILSNTAVVSCNESDPAGANNTATVGTTVVNYTIYLPLVDRGKMP